METHDKYIDIQMPLTAVETMGWKATNELKEPTAPYNPEKDITFFADKPTTYIEVQPGEFAIFFPKDGHAPGIAEGNLPQSHRKSKTLIPHFTETTPRKAVSPLLFYSHPQL